MRKIPYPTHLARIGKVAFISQTHTPKANARALIRLSIPLAKHMSVVGAKSSPCNEKLCENQPRIRAIPRVIITATPKSSPIKIMRAV